eukprot:sb/3478437/
MEDMDVEDYKGTNGLFSKDYDTNLLNNIGDTSPPGKEDNTANTSPKFDSRTFARNTHVNNIVQFLKPRVESEYTEGAGTNPKQVVGRDVVRRTAARLKPP